MSWIQNKWAFTTIFRLRDDNNLLQWYYIKQLISNVLEIIDGIIDTITLNYIISNIQITWLCMIPDHFFHEKHMRSLSKKTTKEMIDSAEFEYANKRSKDD